MNDEEDEPLDPRIQDELEKLNKASLLINKLENDLDAERSKFKSHLSESTQQLEMSAKKLSNCIEHAKPYYDSRMKASQIHIQVQQAAARYERAISMQAAAREMVELAEQGYETRRSKQKFDTSWQEMLNHATIKVMDAENERVLSQAEHQRLSVEYADIQEEVNDLYKKHKKSIVKSKFYYELKAKVHGELEKKKTSIERMQKDRDAAKKLYAKALANLGAISEEIHNMRQRKQSGTNLGVREAGVGSESPVPFTTEKRHRLSTIDSIDSEKEILISFPPNKADDTAANKPPIESDSTPNDAQNIKHVTDNMPVSNDLELNNAETKSDTEGEDTVSTPPTVLITNTIEDGEKSARRTPPPTASINTGVINRDKNLVTRTRSDFSITSFNSDNSAISPIIGRHRRAFSGTLQLSAKRLLEDAAALSDNDSTSVSSFVVMDDEGVANAMSDEYFDGSYEANLRMSTHEDYSQLPESLARYQKKYEQSRRALANDSCLKLDQVLKLLDDSNDESVV